MYYVSNTAPTSFLFDADSSFELDYPSGAGVSNTFHAYSPATVLSMEAAGPTIITSGGDVTWPTPATTVTLNRLEADKKNVKFTIDIVCGPGVTDCTNSASATTVISNIQAGSILSESILVINGVSTSSICLVS